MFFYWLKTGKSCSRFCILCTYLHQYVILDKFFCEVFFTCPCNYYRDNNLPPDSCTWAQLYLAQMQLSPGRQILHLPNKCQLSYSLLNFTDPHSCYPGATRLKEKNPVSVSAFCTQKARDQLPLRNVYRRSNVTGIYFLSARKSHLCYDVQVLPDMTNLTQLSGGKYYEIVF